MPEKFGGGIPPQEQKNGQLIPSSEERQEMATRVGGQVIRTHGTREDHMAAVHEATLRLRSPEQIAEIEKKKPEFDKAIRDFRGEALKRFEETGNFKKAIDDALFDVFGETIRSEDNFE